MSDAACSLQLPLINDELKGNRYNYMLAGADVASSYKVVSAVKANIAGEVALALKAEYNKDGLLK